MNPEIEVEDYVRIRVDRISNNGNAIALTPKGNLHVTDGEEGEETVVRVGKEGGHLIGEKVPVPSDADIISLADFYEVIEERREREERKKKEFEKNKPNPPNRTPGDETANMRRMEQLKKKTEKKSKKERERENLNRILRGDM